MTLQPPGLPPLQTKDDILHYLDFVLDQGDPKALIAALADIAKAARKLPPDASRDNPLPRVGGTQTPHNLVGDIGGDDNRHAGAAVVHRLLNGPYSHCDIRRRTSLAVDDECNARPPSSLSMRLAFSRAINSRSFGSSVINATPPACLIAARP
jgi:hypothetical protein